MGLIMTLEEMISKLDGAAGAAGRLPVHSMRSTDIAIGDTKEER
jgi:hypothetical protein